MAVASGTALVLITWLVCLLVLISLGLLPSLILTRTSRSDHLLRTALWWGLLIVLILAISMSLWAPLGGATSAVTFLLGVCLIGVPGWVTFARRRPSFRLERKPWGTWLLGLTALSVTGYLAIAALGPVTNYDSGLYHLGAIRYASEFAAIPGLANLYFPFGYGTAHFPMAALLTNGPWGVEGYRLLNGLILTMAGADLVLRSLRRRPGPGFYVLAVGLTATWVPMVALSDYWVTSPSQDSMALTLTVVASAYLADAVAGRRSWTAAGATCVGVATSLTLVRPTMGAYLVGSILVLGTLAIRRRRTHPGAVRATSLALGFGFAALVATTARDRILSGWFQYPLSLFPFDVPWLASDPSSVREATLGFHRNPEDLWNSIDGWNWIGPWLGSRVSQWETYELLALGLLAALSTGWALWRSSSAQLARRMSMTTFPSVLAVLVWWSLTPPSYRFAWGAIFTLFSIPTGWALWSLTTNPQTRLTQQPRFRNVILSGLTVPVLVVVAFSAAFRLNVESMTGATDVNVGISIPITVAPVPLAPVEEVDLESGLDVVRPIESDQCWWAYPLCTPGPDPRLKPLNGPWPRGFTLS